LEAKNLVEAKKIIEMEAVSFDNYVDITPTSQHVRTINFAVK